MIVLVLVHNRSAVKVFDKPLPDLGMGVKKSLMLDGSTLNGNVRGACNRN